MSPKTTQDTHVLLVPCAEMTHVQLNMHVRTTQALDNMRVPHVEFRDIRLTRECMWFQHVLFCSVAVQDRTKTRNSLGNGSKNGMIKLKICGPSGRGKS